MRRLPVITALALALVGVAAAGDAAADKKALQGTWTLVELTERGKPSEGSKGMELAFSGENFAMKKQGETVGSGTFKVDPSKKPKTIEITVKKGGDTTTVKGIYELEGDTLRVCHFTGPKAETNSPVKFEATADTTVVVLKRAK
jgi:uncharacterized protein (TIGR03067 family)